MLNTVYSPNMAKGPINSLFMKNKLSQKANEQLRASIDVPADTELTAYENRLVGLANRAKNLVLEVYKSVKNANDGNFSSQNLLKAVHTGFLEAIQEGAKFLDSKKSISTPSVKIPTGVTVAQTLATVQ